MIIDIELEYKNVERKQMWSFLIGYPTGWDENKHENRDFGSPIREIISGYEM
jgi:hypothetical protein